MQWNDAKDAIINFLSAGGIYWAASEIYKMRISMEALLTKTLHHEKKLEEHAERITAVEKQRV